MLASSTKEIHFVHVCAGLMIGKRFAYSSLSCKEAKLYHISSIWFGKNFDPIADSRCLCVQQSHLAASSISRLQAIKPFSMR